MKSTVDEIRERFDHDVERFADFETGQSATIDSPLMLKLVAEAAAAVTPEADHLLDIGCGAGNYSLALLKRQPGMSVTLNDLSQPMLDRAVQRVGEATTGGVHAVCGDVRDVAFVPDSFDVVVAAMVLHHLRSDAEWELVCDKLYRGLRPGGSIWIVDLVSHSHLAVQAMMQRRYSDYLLELGDEAYRDHVFDYIEREDSPIPAAEVLQHLHRTGFARLEVLHKNVCFAAMGGEKPQ